MRSCGDCLPADANYFLHFKIRSARIEKHNLQTGRQIRLLSCIFGDVPKWLKGPHSKCGRSGNPRRESSNLSISAKLSLDAHRVPSSAFSFALRSRLDWLSVLSQSYRLNQDIIRVPDTVFIKLASRAFREFYISTSDPAAAIHDTGLFTVFRQQPK